MHGCTKNPMEGVFFWLLDAVVGDCLLALMLFYRLINEMDITDKNRKEIFVTFYCDAPLLASRQFEYNKVVSLLLNY